MTRRFTVVLLILLLALIAALAVCGYPPRNSWRQTPTGEIRNIMVLNGVSLEGTYHVS